MQVYGWQAGTMHRLLGGRDARTDPAVVTKDASGKVHESKVEDAVKHAVTGVNEQTAQEVGVDQEDIGKA